MSIWRGLWPHWAFPVVLLAILSLLVSPAVMVKRENFKKCDQSGFCRRNRAYADTAASLGRDWAAPYNLDPSSIKFSNGQLSGTILKSIAHSQEIVRLPLTVTFLQSGTARVTVDEEKRKNGDIELRHESRAKKQRFNEAEEWAIVGDLTASRGATLTKASHGESLSVLYGPDGHFEAIVHHSPFRIEFKRDGQTQVKFNERGYMNVEHWRPKIETPPKAVSENEEEGAAAEAAVETSSTQATEDESTWWEEHFGGNTDSKPKGPESVGLDISFHGYEHVYGIPGHTGPLSLKETRGGEGNYDDPYRLYNSDVFEYEIDSPMTLYGSIPFMQAHKKDATVGILWLNAAETWIDITKARSTANTLSMGVAGHVDTQTHWLSESGLLDVFVFLGPSTKDISKSYGELTGYPQLPQEFAIGYHQCRWNYVSDEDVRDVDRKFDRHSIPYDVIWLDIEYTEGKKYFTWDPLTFSDPIGMQKQLDNHERKLVVIIDPHIKNEGGYHVVDELKSKDLAVKNKDGNQYEGWCWPGSSYWPDFFNPAAISWWKSLFTYDKFKGTAANSFLWNDMNEPSVFNGPETTMPKDNMHHGGWEHRDVHNLYGMSVINASYEGLLERDKKGALRRPFILTRSFFVGSQRLGAMWTGDNRAAWDHLQAALPMILSQGIAGFPFAGADVGGFFGNPSKELQTRWYQAGAFYPFFRAHAHIDARRREPYLLGSPYTEIMTQALRLRYALLPAWYTAFHEASVNGTPIVQPNYYVHPSDEKGFAIDDQLYLGSTGLLFKPVVTEGAESVDVYIADDEPYYDYFDYQVYSGKGHHTVNAPLDKIPLLMQGGHIIPRRDRPRRSSGLMKWDPITLVVVLDKQGNADGELYLDDGESFEYQDGALIHRRFTFDKGTNSLTSTDSSLPNASKSKKTAYLKRMQRVTVEKVVIVGAPKEWKAREEVEITEESGNPKRRKASMKWTEGESTKADWAVIKNPGVRIGNSWTITFR